MSWEQGLAAAVILFLGSLLQGAIGFAFVLFALPLLLWAGLPLSHSVALVLVSVLAQVAVGVYQLRDSIRWRSTFFATALRYATLPVGLLILVQLDSLELDSAKQVIGILVLLLLALTIFGKAEPKEKLHPGWGWLAFSSSGILQGMAAVGGPPLVLWVMAHSWSNAETRAFLFSCFLLTVPMQIGLLLFNFRESILYALGTGLLFSPLIAFGSALGVQLGHRISKPVLKNISYFVLFISAIISILAPFF